VLNAWRVEHDELPDLSRAALRGLDLGEFDLSLDGSILGKEGRYRLSLKEMTEGAKQREPIRDDLDDRQHGNR
jgi:hypothetical protein